MDSAKAPSPPAYTLTCQRCGEAVPAEPWAWRHSCGGTLGIKIDIDADRVCATRSVHGRLSRFGPVLPLSATPDTAAGDTPVLYEYIEGVRVGFKLEYTNPGGSFKDRGSYVAVARCVELGFTSIVVDSSGNAGVSKIGRASCRERVCVGV